MPRTRSPKPGSEKLAALSRLFSATVFRELSVRGQSKAFARLLKLADLESPPNKTVADGFDIAFESLKRSGDRDEYVYRSALTQKVLLGRHSLNTAAMLTEFRTGSCRADLVILNGTATVYEIKSERDSLNRLAAQVDEYRKVFASVNVIACNKHLDQILTVIPDDVGLLNLSDRFRIQVVREGAIAPWRISPTSIFDSLQSVEATKILQRLGIEVPAVPNTKKRQVLRSLFADLDPETLHGAVVRTLRDTRKQANFSHVLDNLPRSLHAAALTTPIKQQNYARLLEAVMTPLAVAKNWDRK
ncbi:phage-related protein Cll [Salinisphaera shabanensis E1L3A]|uniref:Phage-related protein Cll n=1 Tax=Salinisphaera shabanensis E1L3A TaxID=1033802 RepID=U2FUS7_9GAMM|nr:sce7726 family protein [Salinisphaera shabanensis]ERJ19689.1 phage-related protein Cll [Salinisphaera shabanensis E1L3A]